MLTQRLRRASPNKHLHISLVEVTPAPVFTRLKGFDDWVPHCLKVFGGMLVLRRIAATNMAAGQAKTKMNPRIAGCKAFLAPISARCDRLNLVAVVTGWHEMSFRNEY